ncbi:MAG: hypothetical protein JKY89_02745 [Immundisolibacteraceae bacterium]|nr:hypothetical protein [Immundisolibacteraceae bacterium]
MSLTQHKTRFNHGYQLGQGMVEYVVVLATVVFALLVPLNGAGSNNVIEEIEQVLQNNYQGYSFAVTLSEMPDAVSMEEALQMYEDAGGDPGQLTDAADIIQKVDDFLGMSFEDLIPDVTDFSVADLLDGELPSFGDSEDAEQSDGNTPLYNEDGEAMTLATVFIDGDGDIFELNEAELFAQDDTDENDPLTEDEVCTDSSVVRLPVTDTSTSSATVECDGSEGETVLDSNGNFIGSDSLVTNDDNTVAVIGNGFVVGIDDDEDDILLNEDDVTIESNGEIFLITEEVDTSGFSFP